MDDTTPRDPSCAVIVPARNCEAMLRACLEAVFASNPRPTEVIVVDDASTDGTADVAKKLGARVIRLPTRSGPGAARNAGVALAAGDVVVFVDADVIVQTETIARLIAHLRNHATLSAVFGSYDAEPASPEFLSQYRNLLHHYTHQVGKAEAYTFWAGCGAVRRASFDAIGGFDAVAYPVPSMEDIELGARLITAGGRIRLDPTIQAKHLKRWTFVDILRTDILRRAWPWSKLIAEGRAFAADLNLRWRDRLCGVLVVLLLAATALGPILLPSWLWLTLIPVAGVVTVVFNWALYRFFLARRGGWFALRVVPMHLLYYVTSSVVFGSAVILTKLRRFAGRR